MTQIDKFSFYLHYNILFQLETMTSAKRDFKKQSTSSSFFENSEVFCEPCKV